MGIFFNLWGFNWLIYEGVVGVVACFQFTKTFWINYFVSIILEATTLLHYYTTTLITPFIPFSIQLYGHQKIIHIIGPTFCVFVRHRVTAPSFSVRKYVYFVHTILTVYLTILHSFLSVSSRRCGACAAPSAEHARPQASRVNELLFNWSLSSLSYSQFDTLIIIY